LELDGRKMTKYANRINDLYVVWMDGWMDGWMNGWMY
jgi:hypothetical protein